MIEVAVSLAFGIPLRTLRRRSRGKLLIPFARQTAMYLAHVVFGMSYSDVGRCFRRDRTTAAHACRVVERRRDDPAVDALVGMLEAVCATWRDDPTAGRGGCQ